MQALMIATLRDVAAKTPQWMIGFAATIAALMVIWKFPPTRATVKYLGRGFWNPVRDNVLGALRTVVREETEDIRKQVFPNGGSSLADRIARADLEVSLIKNGLSGLGHDLRFINERMSRRDLEITAISLTLQNMGQKVGELHERTVITDEHPVVVMQEQPTDLQV